MPYECSFLLSFNPQSSVDSFPCPSLTTVSSDNVPAPLTIFYSLPWNPSESHQGSPIIVDTFVPFFLHKNSQKGASLPELSASPAFSMAPSSVCQWNASSSHCPSHAASLCRWDNHLCVITPSLVPQPTAWFQISPSELMPLLSRCFPVPLIQYFQTWAYRLPPGLESLFPCRISDDEIQAQVAHDGDLGDSQGASLFLRPHFYQLPNLIDFILRFLPTNVLVQTKLLTSLVFPISWCSNLPLHGLEWSVSSRTLTLPLCPSSHSLGAHTLHRRCKPCPSGGTHSSPHFLPHSFHPSNAKSFAVLSPYSTSVFVLLDIHSNIPV